MKIVKGSGKYIDSCSSIANKLTQHFSEKAVSNISRDLRKHIIYIAIEMEEVLGFASIVRLNENVAEISWIAVKKERQNQGVGSSLINYISDDLKAEGVTLLKVKTLSENVDNKPYESTRKFYEKMGFVHLETIDPYPGWEPGNPCAIYVKIL
jgi:ribosomal protein S18 acetylase RimI-like enzyme